ncbi:glycosyltransferase family 4 protein [Heliophilum fasciatum]|uniref:Glycosyltransferase involved in cell wall biosynthesis n=1 Tax=Heliophilum fasciatum TaxID=35700 RepID=A0A4R2RNZ8_9FIRM|nr:glycosyltransferase family 4 protein [Heliophilum fasciatum]MCW2279002.1 glycosyltransferase involved in cell wall biosynthesis [Heliophilum fasciatum]TCP64047.1 glycosyltransferase involved in cell wall biosynthesis [Heliophilum fasciatum]
MTKANFDLKSCKHELLNQGGISATSTLKVIQVITLSETGGAQRVVFELLKGLEHLSQSAEAPVRYDLSLACFPGGRLIEHLQTESPGVRIYPLNNMRRNIDFRYDLKTFWELYQLFRRESPDIVHCHSSKAGLLGRLAAKLAGVSCILFTVHGWSFYGTAGWKRRIFVELEKIMALITDKIVCVSHKDYQEGFKAGVFIDPQKEKKEHSQSRISVIHNGIPGEVNREPRENKEREWSALFRVITVGRLAEQKDPWLFLDAVEMWKERTKEIPVEFTWVGDGPLAVTIQEEIERRDLGNMVALLGDREDVDYLLSQADVFLLTSKWEGLPIVILEAMRAAVPVVTVDVGGVKEQIIDGDTGIIVPNRNPEDIVTSLERMAQDEMWRRKLGNNARRRFLANFTVEKMIKTYERCYISGMLVRNSKAMIAERYPMSSSGNEESLR